MIIQYSQELQDEIIKTHSEINQLYNKNDFYTPEEKFELINIDINNQNIKRLKLKNKEVLFDFHIKNGDEYVYEKIVID